MPNINNVPTTQYIGPRIIPHFADPSEWSINREYDALSIVTQGGNTYWAKTNVPAGIQITNTTYWYLSAYPDAQIQQYRAEVQAYAAEVETFDGRITTNATDITTTNTRITTLNNQMDSRVTAIENELDASLSEMVVIGDSFSTYYVPASQSWYKYVADALNVTPRVFAERSAGFAHVGEHGNTFQALLTQAIQSTAFDNDKVGWVFIYGGLNDLIYSTVPSAITSNFPSLIQDARTAFPHARIVVCGINSWATGLTQVVTTATTNRGQIYYEHLMHDRINALGAGISFISMCLALAFNEDWYSDSNRHPNAEGHKVIASWILSNLFGSGMSMSISGDVFDTDGNDVGAIAVYTGAGIMKLRCQTLTAGDSLPIHDAWNIFRETYFNLAGLPIGVVTNNEPVYGMLGAHVNNTYDLNTYGHGWFEFTGVW